MFSASIAIRENVSYIRGNAMTPSRKYTISTFVFYGLAVSLLPIAGRHMSAGPCNPGLGFFYLMLMILVAAFGFVICIAARLMGRKAFTWPALINGAVLLILVVLFHFT